MTSPTPDLQRAPLPNTITWVGGRVSTYELQGKTDIKPITLLLSIIAILVPLLLYGALWVVGKAWSFPTRPIDGAFGQKKHEVLGHGDPYVPRHADLGD